MLRKRLTPTTATRSAPIPVNISVRILDATVVNVPAIIVTTAKNATPGQNDNNRPSLL